MDIWLELIMKRGISSIIASVFIILLVIVAVAIIWVSVLPNLKTNLKFSSVDLSIEKSEGWTGYDSTKNVACIQIRRGPSGDDFKGIEVVFDILGNSEEFLIPDVTKNESILEVNSLRTYCFEVGGKPDSVKIAPVFFDGSLGKFQEFKLDEVTFVGNLEIFGKVNHPYIFLNSGQIYRARLRMTNSSINQFGFSYKSVADSIVSKADGFVANNLVYSSNEPCSSGKQTTMNNYNYVLSSSTPGRHSDCSFPAYTGISSKLQERINYLLYAYVLTNQTKYADEAKKELISVSKWSQWYDPDWPGEGYSEVSDIYITITFANAYDVLYNYLSESERQEIKTAMINKGVVLENSVSISSPSNPLSFWSWPNGYIGKSAAMGLAELAIKGEPEYNQALFDIALNAVRNSIASEGKEGSVCETISYGGSVSYILYFIGALKNLGIQQDLGSLEFFSNLPNFYQDAKTPGGIFPNFGDSVSSLDYNDAFLLYPSYFPSKIGEALFILNQSNVGAEPGSIFFLDDVPMNEIVGSSQIYNGAFNSAFLRGNNFMLAMKGSETCTWSHQHADANSFVVGSEKWLLTDPGYVFSGQTSDFHNSILIDGLGQTNRSAGKLINFSKTDSYDYVIGEANNTYASGLINKFERTALVVKNKNPFFIIYDNLSSSSAREYKLDYHSLGAISGSGLISFSGSSSALKMFVNSSGSFSQTISSDAFGNKIEFTPSTKNKDEYFFTLIFPYKKYINLSFESDSEVGMFSGGSHKLTLTRDCGEKYSGSCSLKSNLYSSDLGIATGNDFIEVDVNQTYSIGAYVKNPDNLKTYLGLYYYDSAYKYIDYSYLYSGRPSISGWNYYGNFSFRMPNATKYVKLFFISGDAQVGSAWFDNFVLKPVSETSSVEPQITLGEVIKSDYGGEVSYILLNPKREQKIFNTEIGQISSSALICVANSSSRFGYLGIC